jgi:mannitol/fructose-specific phosphotransferase system IIA component
MVQRLVMSSALIQAAGIRIDAAASSREEAVALCGKTLLELGSVAKEYIPAMWEREQIISSFMGEGVAMPHGTDEARKFVIFDQLVFIRFAQEINWDGVPVRACIGIAANGDSHGQILGNLAEVLIDDEKRTELFTTLSVERILELLETTEEEQQE